MSENKIFQVETGYGSKTQLPYVQVSVGQEMVQMSPEDARALGLNLMAGAEAALGDAFLFEFMSSIGLDEKEAATTMFGFRAWRRENDVLPGHGQVQDG